MILIDRKTKTITAVLGTGSDTVITNNSILVQVYVNPTTATTTYDFTITDTDSNIIYKSLDNQGTLNDTNVSVASGGNWTVTIANASVDEDFDVVLLLRRS